MNVGFISLGCSKNLVDTEMMIGLFKDKGFKIVSNPEDAEIIVVNTCGFIESAKEEAISTLLEMAEYKNDKCKFLVATGCMVERYKEELQKELPEVDLFIKFSEYNTFWEQIVENGIPDLKEKEYNRLDFNQRIISTGVNYAYLRIADGCDNFCTFCAIPDIRGRFKSRKKEDIIEEARILAKQGIRELILIAQDTTKYGVDIYDKPMLAELVNDLSEIEEIKWIRFLYSYPETITDDLIDVVKNNKKVCKYFDIPMQHCSNTILKKMNRKTTKEKMKNLIIELRNKIPGVIIRSTLMVGFPGETEEDFKELYKFVEWAKFDKLGCFTYSKEDGTAAEKMPEQIHYRTKQARYNKIMELQQNISKVNLERFIGKEYDTLIEDAYVNEDGELYFVGRTYMDVPEIDGYIYLKGDKELQNKIELNEFYKCEITDVKEYDLIGEFRLV